MCVCVSILIYISIYKLHKSPPKDILSLLSKKYGSKKLDQFPDHQQKKQLNSDFPLVFFWFSEFWDPYRWLKPGDLHPPGPDKLRRVAFRSSPTVTSGEIPDPSGRFGDLGLSRVVFFLLPVIYIYIYHLIGNIYHLYTRYLLPIG